MQQKLAKGVIIIASQIWKGDSVQFPHGPSKNSTHCMQINSSTYQHMCRNPHLGQENLLVDFQAQNLVRNNGFD